MENASEERWGGGGEGAGGGGSSAPPDESSRHVLTHLPLEGAIICREGLYLIINGLFLCCTRRLLRDWVHIFRPCVRVYRKLMVAHLAPRPLRASIHQ